MFFGISASYAGVHVGSQVTDASTLKDGSKILLRASTKEGSTDPAQYKWLSSLKDSMVWAVNELTLDAPIDPYTPFVLEAAEGDIKGKPVFYVKNVKNNMYITYLFEDTVRNEEGELEGSIIINDKGGIDAQCRLDYTSDKATASAFAFVLASEGVNWNINGDYTGDKQPEATSMMMFTVCKEYTDGELLLALNQAYGTPWAANYTDWGGWFEVYLQNESVPVVYKEDLTQLLTKLNDISYIGGTAPGCYDAALAKAFDDAKEAARTALNNGSATEADFKVAYENLETAWLNLVVLSPNPITSGYYMFKSATSTNDLYRYMYATSGQAKWINWQWNPDEPKLPDANYVWEITERADGSYFMRSIGLNQYVSGTGANGATGSPTITLSKDSVGNIVNFIDKGYGYFVVRQKGGNSLHAEATNTNVGATGNLVAWNYSDDQKGGASQWQFVMLSEDSVELFKKQGEQLILDQNLGALIDVAQSKYDLGSKYQAYLTSPALIWSNAAHKSTDDVYTNPRGVWGGGADGGGYPALLDGDEKTYFHSAWGGTIAEYHYLQFDLSETPTDGFFFTYTRRPGTSPENKDRPKTIVISATNDTVGGGTWKEITTLSDLDVTSATVTSDSVELDAPYKYVRFTITETNTPGDTLNGYPFFSMAELQLYSTKMSETCFNAQNPELAAAFAKAIADAKAVKAGETTQDDIDNLQNAIDAYLSEFPDPTALKNLISVSEEELAAAIAVDQKTEINGFNVYPDPGTYPAAAKTDFENVLNEAKEYVETNSELGIFDADKLAEFETKIAEAKATFLSKIRTIKFADDTKDGNWYYLAAANNYYKLQGLNSTEMRTGVIYVQGNGTLANSTIYWATTDSIEKQGVPLDNAKWRFIQLTDSTYAIQNKGTQLYIGQEVTHPAYLSASPVAFELQSKGYAAYLFKGYRLNGEPVSNNYLHSQTSGQTLVYWNSTNFGGSTWEIHNADVDRTEAGEEVKNYRTKEITNFMKLQAGKLYAMCYPVGFDFMYDGDALSCMYGINAISDTELTLEPIDAAEPGQPFFYLAGNNQSLLKPAPTASDTVTVAMKISDFKEVAMTPMMVNGLVGEYNNVTYPKGMSALVETIETDDSDVVISRTQTIQAASGETGWNSAYIMAGAIENQEEVAGSIKVKISGKLDTAIEDAIIDAQLGNVNVYSIDGVLIKKNVKASEATNGLAKGLYIIGNTKVVVK